MEDIDDELINLVLETPKKVDALMDDLKVSDAIAQIFEIFRRANKYIDETTPWILAKEENTDRLKTVIYNLLESIRSGAVMLQPFLPETADKIFEQLNTTNKSIESIDFKGLEVGSKLGEAVHLFDRIDKEEKKSEIENM